MLRIELVKSMIGQTPRNVATAKALGLRKMHNVVFLPDNASVRGQIHHCKHMLSVTVVEDQPFVAKAIKKKAAAPAAAATPAPAAEAEAKPKAKRTTKKAAEATTEEA